jgi:hypothetical protein
VLWSWESLPGVGHLIGKILGLYALNKLGSTRQRFERARPPRHDAGDYS